MKKSQRDILMRECIIIGGKASGGNVLGKTRDRNYRPKLEIVRELIDDIELVYLHDMYTDYIEGMNSEGIGIINAALLVARDEKAATKYWDRHIKKKGSSHDGPRIHKALCCSKLSRAIKSLVGYDTGLKGHTMVGNPTTLYSIEMTSKHNPIVKKLDPSTGFDVRTNHGEDHEGAGYNPDTHPEDYLSSKIRKATAQSTIADIGEPSQLMPALAAQSFEKDSNYNMLRSTDNMKTSSQVLMNLGDREFNLYVIPDQCTFKGIVDKTPAGHTPKIKINIIRYK
jgi:hypothetical protein